MRKKIPNKPFHSSLTYQPNQETAVPEILFLITREERRRSSRWNSDPRWRERLGRAARGGRGRGRPGGAGARQHPGAPRAGGRGAPPRPCPVSGVGVRGGAGTLPAGPRSSGRSSPRRFPGPRRCRGPGGRQGPGPGGAEFPAPKRTGGSGCAVAAPESLQPAAEFLCISSSRARRARCSRCKIFPFFLVSTHSLVVERFVYPDRMSSGLALILQIIHLQLRTLSL